MFLPAYLRGITARLAKVGGSPTSPGIQGRIVVPTGKSAKGLEQELFFSFSSEFSSIDYLFFCGLIFCVSLNDRLRLKSIFVICFFPRVPRSAKGTYAPLSEANPECFGCPGGKYVTEHRASVCVDCPIGRFVNHTGEGYKCLECPVGRSSRSRVGLKQCIRCSRNNGKRGGSFYYQDEIGNAECKLCKNSGQIGGAGCDEKSGAIEFSKGHCWGLYTTSSKCTEQQDIYTSFAVAYSTFVFTVFVLLPFVFISGGLASLTKIWRRDFRVLAIWMSDVTTNAYDLIQIKFDEKMRRWREENVRDIFAAIISRQEARRNNAWCASNRVHLDDTLSHHLHDKIGLGSNMFVALLKKALRTDESSNVLSYGQFRRFLSLVVQRLASARDLMRSRLIFKELAEGENVITCHELEQLPNVIGASVLSSEDWKILTRHLDQNGGTLDMNGFSAAMHFVATERKMRQLYEEKKSKDRKVRTVFAKYVRKETTTQEEDEGCLDVYTFKAASIELGLAWSLEDIREIQHAAKQRQAGRRLSRHHLLMYAILDRLESGIWHWLVVLPLVVLALRVDGKDASLFRDIFVPIVLSLEVFIRAACFFILGKSVFQFLGYNGHNAVDMLTSLFDVVLIIFVVTGSPEGKYVSAIAPLARFARLLPIAQAVLPLRRVQNTLAQKLWCQQSEHPGDVIEEGKLRVNLNEFRRFVSVCKMNEVRERPVWPFPSYRQAFLKYDQDHGTHSGAVPRRHLKALVHAAGYWPSPYQLAKIEAVLTTTDDDGTQDPPALIYFDDFIEAISIVRDEQVESEMLSSFETEVKRTRRTRVYMLKQLAIGTVAGIFAFLGQLVKLATTLYVLTQATFGAHRVDVKLNSYAQIFSELAISMSLHFPLATSALLGIVSVLQIVFDFLVWLGSYFQFVSLL